MDTDTGTLFLSLLALASQAIVEGWPIPTLVDDDDTVAADYGVDAFPYSVAIDAEGRIVARTSGELDEVGLEAIIAAARG